MNLRKKVMIRRIKQHIRINNLHALFNATAVIDLTLETKGHVKRMTNGIYTEFKRKPQKKRL